MSYIKKNNNFISYLIILLWLFILVFFTKAQIYAVPENNDMKSKLVEEEKSKRKQLTRLEIQQKELNNSSSKKFKEISKYETKINDYEVIEFIYWHIFTNFGWAASIKSLSIWDERVWELWFMESSIWLELKISNEKKMIQLLKFLLNQDKYNFFIESFSYPYKKSSRPFTIRIPIKVLYK